LNLADEKEKPQRIQGGKLFGIGVGKSVFSASFGGRGLIPYRRTENFKSIACEPGLGGKQRGFRPTNSKD